MFAILKILPETRSNGKQNIQFKTKVFDSNAEAFKVNRYAFWCLTITRSRQQKSAQRIFGRGALNMRTFDVSTEIITETNKTAKHNCIV